ncbi:MAG TPA: MCE family protein [Actinophytocola sp.]|uniref:MCE family protein n=1 Tax=Actinophytocola sp. TaxID=1872138 RepID=UPI002DDCAA2E|nr:MCE family protein [Actinophytocola sp.]HEV2784395.1 MCE family protein [Actinophytocola sp.]
MIRLLAALCAGATLLTGCGFSGMYEIPLPGGADLGDRPYRVTAQFGNVLDLVPQAAVKVNDVAVGRVERIELAQDNVTAVVHLVVNGDVHLPANAGAELRQSSLLGEKYIQLHEPVGATPVGRLSDGAVIPIQATNRNPEIEEVLGALSLLLNGGIGQLQTIVKEVNLALSGNEPELRAFLSNVDTVVADLDSQKGNIVKAIDSLNRLSGTLVEQTANITAALDRLAPGLEVINAQRDSLVAMLNALDRLSEVAVDTVSRSKADLVRDLELLLPTLRKLAESGANLPNSLQFLVTYPFTDYFLNPLKGDFVNVDVKFDLDLSVLLENMENASTPLIPLPTPGAGVPGSAPLIPELPLPTLPLPSQAPAASDPLSALLGSLLGGGS